MNKRKPVYLIKDDNKEVWVDTVPLDVTDLDGQEKRIYKYEMMRLKALNDRYVNIMSDTRKDITEKDKEIAYLKDEISNLKEKLVNIINNPSQDKLEKEDINK